MRFSSLILLAVVTGCGDIYDHHDAPLQGSNEESMKKEGEPPEPPCVVCLPGWQHESLNVDGVDRDFSLYIPYSYTGGTIGTRCEVPMPVVFLYHANGGSPSSFISGAAQEWKTIAEREQVALVLPHQMSHCIWDDTNGDGIVQPAERSHEGLWGDDKVHGGGVSLCSTPADDVAFFRQLVFQLNADGIIDPERVYGSGFRHGGDMVAKIVLESSDRIAVGNATSGRRHDYYPTGVTFDPAIGEGIRPFIHISGQAFAEELLGGPVVMGPNLLADYAQIKDNLHDPMWAALGHPTPTYSAYSASGVFGGAPWSVNADAFRSGVDTHEYLFVEDMGNVYPRVGGPTVSWSAAAYLWYGHFAGASL